LRLLCLLVACAALAGTLAACGGSKHTSTTAAPSTTTSVEANATYERSYSECASNTTADLAQKYKVKDDRNVIASAVAKYWAGRAGGGSDAVFAGKQGCFDGFAYRNRGA
jgi:hypothetical protein